jgi:hypothetical protein
MCLVFFTEMSAGERMGVVIAVTITSGILMWYFRKKSERGSAEGLQQVL